VLRRPWNSLAHSVTKEQAPGATTHAIAESRSAANAPRRHTHAETSSAQRTTHTAAETLKYARRDRRASHRRAKDTSSLARGTRSNINKR